MHHPLLLFLGDIGGSELLLIMVVFPIFFIFILLLGAKRITKLFRSTGQGVREFKNASAKLEDEQSQYRDQPLSPSSQPPYQRFSPQPNYSQPQQPLQPTTLPAYDPNNQPR